MKDEYFRVSQTLKAGLYDTLSGTSNRERDMGNQPVLGVIGGLIPADSMVDISSLDTASPTSSELYQSRMSNQLIKTSIGVSSGRDYPLADHALENQLAYGVVCKKSLNA